MEKHAYKGSRLIKTRLKASSYNEQSTVRLLNTILYNVVNSVLPLQMTQITQMDILCGFQCITTENCTLKL